MTHEEKSVLEAALEWAKGRVDEDAILLDGAVRAYRKSLEPMPRYVVTEFPEIKRWLVFEDGFDFCRTNTRERAERIARLLEAEGKS